MLLPRVPLLGAEPCDGEPALQGGSWRCGGRRRGWPG